MWHRDIGDQARLATLSEFERGGLPASHVDEFDVAGAVIDGLMRVQIDSDVPVLSAVLTPRDFHGHQDHHHLFSEHFVKKGTDVARACLQTIDSHHALDAARLVQAHAGPGTMLTTTELEQYLHDHIPLSRAMQVSVLSITDDSVVLGAPLAPNINHRETVFGGSASALAILSAWSLLHTRLRAARVNTRLVIQRNTMDYELPIAGAFTARATLAQADEWPGFLRMLSRKGKSRISVHAVLEHAGQAAGHFSGEFVALDHAAA